mgnify:CR=1 FL=1
MVTGNTTNFSMKIFLIKLSSYPLVDPLRGRCTNLNSPLAGAAPDQGMDNVNDVHVSCGKEPEGDKVAPPYVVTDTFAVPDGA